MKFFLTGISGFIGAYAAHKLVLDGHNVSGITRMDSDIWRISDIKESLNLYSGSLLEENCLKETLKNACPDVVIHFATYGGYPKQKDTKTILETNILGTRNLLEATMLSGVSILINIGSSSEYGAKNTPMKEDMLLEPNTYYGVAKAAQTLLCQQFSKTEGLPVITARLFSVYGPYEEEGRLIRMLVETALSGKPLPLSSPEIARDFVYVADVINLLVKLAEHKECAGEIFNIGTGKQATLKEVVDTVLMITKSKSVPQWGTPGSGRPFDVNMWVADCDKTKGKIGIAKENLVSGLTKTVTWHKKQKQ